MSVDVLLGLQWGDEGKGKIVDFLAPHYQVVARFQGGPNAGHTLEFGEIKHILHQIPSGIFRNDIKNIIGNGVVLDPVVFKKEIEKLIEFDLNPTENLYISKKAHLILPSHRLLDKAYEEYKGDDKIGSTLKGIGPAYQDKVARLGLRVGDILNAQFKSKYRKLVARHFKLLDEFGVDFSESEIEENFFEGAEHLTRFKLVDTDYIINEEIENGSKILCEGAQGSLLDVDFGSYPFVTSSNTTISGASSGLGLAPSKISSVYGIFKAYCTRVGSGPFPTELLDDVGEKLREKGHEFGATTGRPRRCGWLDLPALKYAVMINGVNQLFMMKADVLSNFEKIMVCTGYKLPDGNETDKVPYQIVEENIEPVYKSFKGWEGDIRGITDVQKLPNELIQYIDYLETTLKIPIRIISTGPKRNETVMKDSVLA